MGISKTNNKLMEIASRRLSELGENSSTFKRFNALLRSAAATGDCPKFQSVPSTPKITFGTTTTVSISGCPAQSCIGKGVVDLLVRRPELFTFNEACAILYHCNVTRHRNFIEDFIRKYAIVITGLEGFEEKDLDLAVYFFIEAMFGIQVNMVLCKRINGTCHVSAIGVIFDSTKTKEEIVKKRCILDDSGIAIGTTFDIYWIVEEFCDDDIDD